MKILIVDDDKLSRLTLEATLSKCGRCACADNGRDGVELFTQALDNGDPYGLIFMDIQMADTDGVQATRAIRSGPFAGTAKAAIPIIAMTAYAMTGDRDKFLAAGMNDYLAKPVDMAMLTQIVEKYRGTGRKASD